MAANFEEISKALKQVYSQQALDSMMNQRSPFAPQEEPPPTTFMLLAPRAIDEFVTARGWKCLRWASTGLPCIERARHVEMAAWIRVDGGQKLVRLRVEERNGDWVLSAYQ